MNQHSLNIWIVIPGYNEHKYISTVLAKVRSFHNQVIYVDDGSTDNSAEIALQATPNVLVHPINLGKGAALKTGCDYAFEVCDADAVIMMDADDQHDPAHIPTFIQALQEGNPLVLGIRDHQQMPFFRRAFNQLSSELVKYLYGQYVPDIPSGYKAFTKDAYQQLRWEAKTYEVEMEIAVRAAKMHVSFVTLPIATIYHDFSRGMTMLDVLSALGHIITWRIGL